MNFHVRSKLITSTFIGFALLVIANPSYSLTTDYKMTLPEGYRATINLVGASDLMTEHVGPGEFSGDLGYGGVGGNIEVFKKVEANDSIPFDYWSTAGYVTLYNFHEPARFNKFNIFCVKQDNETTIAMEGIAKSTGNVSPEENVTSASCSTVAKAEYMEIRVPYLPGDLSYRVNINVSKNTCLTGIEEFDKDKQYLPGDQTVYKNERYIAVRYTDIGVTPDQPHSGWNINPCSS